MPTDPVLCLQAPHLRLCRKLPWLTRLHIVLVITSLTTMAYHTMAGGHLCTVRCYRPNLAVPQVASMCCPTWKPWKDGHLGKHQCGPVAQPWGVRASHSHQLGRPRRMTPSVTWSNQTSGVLVAVTAVLACPKTLYEFCVVLPHAEMMKLCGYRR